MHMYFLITSTFCSVEHSVQLLPKSFTIFVLKKFREIKYCLKSSTLLVLKKKYVKSCKYCQNISLYVFVLKKFREIKYCLKPSTFFRKNYVKIEIIY